MMAKSIECVVPGCAFHATAATEEELLAHVAEHAREGHGLSEISPELLAKVKAAVRTEPDRR
jgi:predicted small metal-binding protein